MPRSPRCHQFDYKARDGRSRLALGLTRNQECTAIIADFKTACHNYLIGRISNQALQVLRRPPKLPLAEIE
ncbi:hypothetical protein HPB48_007823 [Haemaphysalis longicornis]|uniref:Uncharacterized protein n=1 Tax=Haemaphysalis longicornis TaxID=44386 RepID=A0A9J6G206_HAELO|nr:hypothetical protein HPB48_007823 [Haemaphysalis longicornis]